MANQYIQQFKLGNRYTTLMELLGPGVLSTLTSKFEPVDLSKFEVMLRELVRYLYLGAYSPNSLFFPGTEDMDRAWHALILETVEYARLCDTLKPGSFIHHSSIEYEDYSIQNSVEDLRTEQASWLVSYVNAFGPISKEAYEILPLAQAIAAELAFNLEQLNDYAKFLLNASVREEPQFEFETFLRSNVRSLAHEIDSSPSVMQSAIHSILHGLHRSTVSGPTLLSPSQLEQVFFESTALGFCIVQHLSAIERLNGIPEWQTKFPELWAKLSSAELLCGLATTHLLHAIPGSLTAEEAEDGFTLTGRSGWVCGYGIFDKLIVGFETTDSVAFALIDFPMKKPAPASDILINVHEMIGLNGMGTCDLQFKEFLVPYGALISRRKKGEAPVIIRPSRYLLPELGIASRAISEIEKLCVESANPKQKLIMDRLEVIKARYKKLADLRDAKAPLDELTVLKDNLLRDLVRLLSLASGPRALLQGSLVARLANEVMFYDLVIQPPKSFGRKVEMVTAGTYEV